MTPLISPRLPVVLLIDSSSRNRETIANALSEHAIACIEATNGISGWQSFLADKPSALLVAVDLPGLRGGELLERVRTRATVPFVFHSTTNDARSAVALLKAGADDFFVIPEEVHTIGHRLGRLLNDHQAQSTATVLQSTIVGRSPPIARVREKLAAITKLRIPVLIRGESGTGLDHLVTAVAMADGRCHSFVAIRPGNTRGPLKGDIGNVVYLDSVESLSLSEQALWLQQIEKCERSEMNAPHRVIASTTVNLIDLVASKRFDSNLAGRLVQFAIDIPSLRERVGDIGPLARHFADELSQRMGRSRVVITNNAIRVLQARAWYGNVRELRTIIEKLIAFSLDGRITRRSVLHVMAEAPSGLMSMRESEARRQREELIALLDATGGNLAEAARRMGMSRGAVIYRAQKFGLLAKQSRIGVRSRSEQPAALSRPLPAEG